MLLEGKAVLVTGASSGIGAAIAELYAAQRPAALYLAARRAVNLDQVATACRAAGADAVEVVAVDLTDSAAVQSLGERLAAGRGVDVLVNCAGVIVRDAPGSGDPAAWERCFAVNVHAPMRLARLLTPGMQRRGGGLIVNVGSVAGVEPIGGCPVYCGSKYSLRGWSLSAAEALRPDNIKVVVLCPGLVDTEMTHDRRATHNEARMMRPRDVAEAALLPLRTSAHCCPTEIVLRNVVPAALTAAEQAARSGAAPAAKV